MNENDSGLRVNKIDDDIQAFRVQVQSQLEHQVRKPHAILGDPAKRVEVGSFPDIPKEFLEKD